MADQPATTEVVSTPAGGRIAYFDNLKYVLIVLVVVGHYIDPFASTFEGYAPLFFFIYLFHMPLFVFSTGLFAHGLIRTDGGFRIARVLQFLVLYLMLYGGIYALEKLNGRDVVFTPWSVGNASWYLLACALWYLLTPLLGGRAGGSGLPRPALLAGLVVVALAAGYFPAVGDFLSLSRVICFAPFFFLGFWTSPDSVAGFTRRGAGWKLAAAGVLLATVAAVYAFPVLLKVRGILTARNAYTVLNNYATYGPAFRLAWLLGAVVLGIAVLFLVPRSRAWFTTLGERTLPIYIWHLFGLRALALVAFIPLVRGWYEVTPLAVAVPLVTGLAAAHLFALKPPFGLIADQVLTLGRHMVVPARPAFVLSLATAVAVPAAAFALSTRPLLIEFPRTPTPWRPSVRVATPAQSEPPQPTPSIAIPAGDFELPLAGATGFAAVTTALEPADGLPGGTVEPGDPYLIRVDEGGSWLVETATAGGRLPAAAQLVSLPDLVPSIVYRPTNATSSLFRSSGVELPGISGERLYPAFSSNPRLGAAEAPLLAVSYPTAVKLQEAQRAALAAGDTLIVHETFRPAGVQRELGRALLAVHAADGAVREGMDPWRPADFAPLTLDNHSLGVAVDVSLGKVLATGRVDGSDGSHLTVTGVQEYPMPTAVHELSRAAAALSRPVKAVDGSEWRGVAPAPGLTEAATRLRDILISAGLAPSAAAWWEFIDWEARRMVPAAATGDFELALR